MSVNGFDVSKHQLPVRWDWPRLPQSAQFMIARASYGGHGPHAVDRHFAEYLERARQARLAVGAYHFYRQTHSWQEQFDLFRAQLARAGGLRPGDLLPVLDLEGNEANGDGKPIADKFNGDARLFAEALVSEFGGCILYMAAYFPSWMGAPASDEWQWVLAPEYRHWIADFSVPVGEPRTPFIATPHIHQPKKRPTPLFNRGRSKVDHDMLMPGVVLDDLRIPAPSVADPALVPLELSDADWAANRQERNADT